MPDGLEEMRARVHGGVGLFDFEGKGVPCIRVDGRLYSQMTSAAGGPLAVNTDLNIMHDGCGNAFVEVSLGLSRGGIKRSFLIDARRDIAFFEALARTSMIAVEPEGGEGSVFMVQLPRPDRAREALGMIRDALGMDGAVTGI